MMHVLVAVIALALLFAVFGLLETRPACGADCGLCKNPCQTRRPDHESD